MRAAKAKNLIFMGSKEIKPAKEASVELVFDNSGKAFNIPQDEVNLKRIVRRTGQSVYKINGETKTRGEVIELLAHAGIDPHGFNIVLQGRIDSIVKMHSEDRRKIIEEVAGIAIYEARKEKSLRELEKTEERLKEISTVLRERKNFLNNLEEEKVQAEKFKKHEEIVRRAKAGILHKKIELKEKEIESLVKSIEEKMKDRNKIKEKCNKLQDILDRDTGRINEIIKNVREASGLEQEKLNDEITDLRSSIEGLRVRQENSEIKREEFERRIDELQKGLPELEKEVASLKEKSPLMAKKSEDLKRKKAELAEIEEQRKILLRGRTELESLREKIRDREIRFSRIESESEQLIKQIDEYSSGLKYKDSEKCLAGLHSLKHLLEEVRNKIKNIAGQELENEKTIVVAESEIKRAEETKKDVGRIDICPLCQSKMSDIHKSHVFEDCDDRISREKNRLEEAGKKLKEIVKERTDLEGELRRLSDNISDCEIESEKHKSIKDKKANLKVRVEEEKELRKEAEHFEEKRKNLELKLKDFGAVEEKYENKMHEIEEISSRTEENLDTALMYKEREIEKIKKVIKETKHGLGEIEIQIEEISEKLNERLAALEQKELEEKKLSEKFKKLYDERDNLQKEVQKNTLDLSEVNGEVRQIEEQINYLKLGKAKVDAEHSAIEFDKKEFSDVQILVGSLEILEDRLRKSQELLIKIGNINLRALEVYDQVKGEYDKVYEKVEILDKEKTEILKIIEEIDKKKKKTFMKTFEVINELFSENFRKLSNKGSAYLEIENREDIFAGGISIIVKMAKGKYFDVTSLSGGEQTLVALSLLFAIQEHKPYHFYIFDEIDAALDKRNSERLAVLLQQYMKSGQYIVVTHNDAVILESNLLYGVSMHEGVSKILSLKVEEDSS